MIICKNNQLNQSYYKRSYYTHPLPGLLLQII